jgi:hypothetical protein
MLYFVFRSIYLDADEKVFWKKADADEKAGDVAYRAEACMALGGVVLAANYFGLLCIAAGGAVDHLLNSIHG